MLLKWQSDQPRPKAENGAMSLMLMIMNNVAKPLYVTHFAFLNAGWWSMVCDMKPRRAAHRFDVELDSVLVG